MDLYFTDRQLDVMNILWNRGSATVREAKEELEEDLAYTSVLTVFQTLEEHGHVDHEREGKAYRYYPSVSRRETGRHAVGYVLRRFFGGSPAALLGALGADGDLSEEQAETLRRAVAEDAG